MGELLPASAIAAVVMSAPTPPQIYTETKNGTRSAIAAAAAARLVAGLSVADLLAAHPWLALCYDVNGATLLHMAAAYGRPAAVRLLTALGASPHSVSLAGRPAVPPTAPPFILAAVVSPPFRLTML